ncbi:sphingosine kinase 1 [Brachyhypopomus gauderio]|uniref:sphingosine kinase 1 n=1 Tax=Brachyhypopomus gauderio TaxID=698409 RepID=UPI004042915F
MDPQASHQPNGLVGALHGEFTDALDHKLRYLLTLTDSCLTVQKITSPPPRDELVLRLVDSVGCRAHQDQDGADNAAYISAWFYPAVPRWMSSGRARQRAEHCFRLALTQDARANLEEAERWARAVRQGASRHSGRNPVPGAPCTQACKAQKMMLLVNPLSGRGRAMTLYTGPVQRMLIDAAVPHTLVVTERQNHARELVRSADLSEWSTLVILSGDGLLFEVINGLMEREDWEQAIHTPLAILPGGSGNALAASVHYYTQADPVWGMELLLSCGFLLCKGAVRPLDILSLHLSSGLRLFSFLSLAWGFIADVDIESERYRYVGAARFMVGTLVRLAWFRSYQGRLAFLPAREACADPPSDAAKPPPPTPGPDQHGPPDDLLAPLGEPVPADWTVVEERDFVLVLATSHSHLAEDLVAAPDAGPADGHIHLFYVRAGVSRATLLRLFLAMEKGTHLACDCPHLVYQRVRALRLEPATTPGVITVDGERVEYGPIQAQIHKGYARLISG